MIMQHLEISPNTYYTPEEAATMLRVSRRNIHALLDTGVARGIKIGRNWRILGRDLLLLPSADDVADAELTSSLMHLSAAAFLKVWDNDEDAVYDAL